MAFSRRQRFSAWDGSQQPQWDADEVMKALADDLMEYGDLRWAMRNLMSRGMQMPQGGYTQGLRDMIRELREQKQRQLKRFNLDPIFEMPDFEHPSIHQEQCLAWNIHTFALSLAF